MVRQVMTSFFFRRRCLRRARAERKGMLDDAGVSSGRKNDVEGTLGDGSGRVGFGGSTSSSKKSSGESFASGRNDEGVNVGEAMQNGSSVTSEKDEAGVGSVEVEDTVDVVDVEADRERIGEG